MKPVVILCGVEETNIEFSNHHPAPRPPLACEAVIQIDLAQRARIRSIYQFYYRELSEVVTQVLLGKIYSIATSH